MFDEIIREDIELLIDSVGFKFLELADKTILITGADGFVPSYFADTVLMLNNTLLKNNPAKLVLLTHHEITKDSRLSHCLNDPKIVFLNGDLNQLSLPDHIDIIIHGASKASPKDYLNLLIETADVNVLGTKKLLEYCTRNKNSKFLLMGSGETYGDTDVSPIPETYRGNVDPIGPRSAYQEAKRFAETLCYIYSASRGVNAPIVRLFHTYGPRLSLNDGRVVSEFIRRAIKGENIDVVDNGPIRTFSYISDSVEAMWRVLLFGKSGQAYNVGSEEEIDIESLAKMIIRITDSSSKIITIPSQNIPHSIATPARATPSIRKVETLGHKNKISLESGLRRLVSWYKNQKALASR